MEKEFVAGIVTLAIAVGCAKCDLDQPHIHFENEPFENSVSTLSHTPTSNVASRAFGFGESDRVAGFDIGRWT